MNTHLHLLASTAARLTPGAAFFVTAAGGPPAPPALATPLCGSQCLTAAASPYLPPASPPPPPASAAPVSHPGPHDEEAAPLSAARECPPRPSGRRRSRRQAARMAVKAHSCQQPRPAPSRWQAAELLEGHSLQGGLHAPFDFQLHWRDGLCSGPALDNLDAMNGLGRTSAPFALDHPDGTNFQLAALIQALSRQEALPDWATLPDPLSSFRDLPTLAEPQQVHETTGHIQHVMAQVPPMTPAAPPNLANSCSLALPSASPPDVWGHTAMASMATNPCKVVQVSGSTCLEDPMPRMEQEAARKLLSEQLDQLYKPFYSPHSQPTVPQGAIPAHETLPVVVPSGCGSADHVEEKPQVLAPSQQKAGKPNPPPRNAWSAELRKAIAAASPSKGALSDKKREPRVAGGWSDYSGACFTAGYQQLPAKHIVEVLLEHRASSDQTSAATKLPFDVAQSLATNGGSLESSSGHKHCRQAGGPGSTWTDTLEDKRARHDVGQQMHDALLQEPLACMDEDASKAPLYRREKEKRRTLTEKRRRERISESLKALQKVTPQPTSHREDTATMLERAREYMLFLESQVQALSSSSDRSCQAKQREHLLFARKLTKQNGKGGTRMHE
eukprot:SM000143S00723  [mRNA]  locus=s143:169980:172617:+ [translate_table: standard]